MLTLEVRNVGLAVSMNKLDMLNEAKEKPNVIARLILILKWYSLCIADILDEFKVHGKEFFQQICCMMRCTR
jgi:hypothetical protein